MPKIIPITDFNERALDIYARCSEKQLYHINEPFDGIFIAESPIVVERALQAGYEPISVLIDKKEITPDLLNIFHSFEGLPIYTADDTILTQLTGFHLTRGLLCAMKRKPLPDYVSICKDLRRIVILENVMNPTNIGAIFRSAAALNMDAVLLTSACSDPLYRRAIRVSMGTVFQIPWTFLPSYEKGQSGVPIDALSSLGFKTVAMALRETSVSINDPKLLSEEKLAIILGTEGDGLCNETIDACDYTVKIPMSHNVDSLNVAAASAVAFWELGK